MCQGSQWDEQVDGQAGTQHPQLTQERGAIQFEILKSGALCRWLTAHRTDRQHDRYEENRSDMIPHGKSQGQSAPAIQTFLRRRRGLKRFHIQINNESHQKALQSIHLSNDRL